MTRSQGHGNAAQSFHQQPTDRHHRPAPVRHLSRRQGTIDPYALRMDQAPAHPVPQGRALRLLRLCRSRPSYPHQAQGAGAGLMVHASRATLHTVINWPECPAGEWTRAQGRAPAGSRRNPPTASPRPRPSRRCAGPSAARRRGSDPRRGTPPGDHATIETVWPIPDGEKRPALGFGPQHESGFVDGVHGSKASPFRPAPASARSRPDRRRLGLPRSGGSRSGRQP